MTKHKHSIQEKLRTGLLPKSASGSGFSAIAAYMDYSLEAADLIDELVEALEGLVADVLDYEKANNLKPNPGKKYCWQSVSISGPYTAPSSAAVERAQAAIRKAGTE